MDRNNQPATGRGGRRRRATASIAALAALGLIALLPGTAAADSDDTFTGRCGQAPGTVSWAPPLTFVPIQSTMTGSMSGGSCTGTLNGRPVNGAPIRVRAKMSGLQACEGGIQTGRFEFTIEGKRIGTTSYYRRVGPVAKVRLRGDDGGSARVIVSARLGVISDQDPLAQNPVLGQFAGSMTFGDAAEQCSGEGMSSAPIRLELLQTTTSISG